MCCLLGKIEGGSLSRCSLLSKARLSPIEPLVSSSSDSSRVGRNVGSYCLVLRLLAELLAPASSESSASFLAMPHKLLIETQVIM